MSIISLILRKNLEIMMNQDLVIRIEVLTPDTSHPGEFKLLNRFALQTCSSIEFDFYTVIKAFYMLYPGKSIFINFSISN